MSFWSTLTWNGRMDRGQPNDFARWRVVNISATARDSGNDPTTTLRKGLMIAVKASDGLAYPYDPDANDGTQFPVGVLTRNLDITASGSPENTTVSLFQGGLLRNGQIIDDDLRSLIDLSLHCQYLSEFRMAAGPNMHPTGVQRHSADYTVTSSDHGRLLLATAAVNFTLPTKVNGYSFRFFQSADANMVITGSSDIIALNNATASTLTFSTSSQKIGSHVLVECVYTATSTLRWVVSNLGGTTMTVA